MISTFLLSLWAFIPAVCSQAITVAQANSDGNFIGSYAIQALFLVSENPLDPGNSSFQGPANSSGTFLNGPWGMDTGAILTTGLASGASFTSANQSTNNSAPGSAFCGANSFDAAVLNMNVTLSANYSGITSTLVYASK